MGTLGFTGIFVLMCGLFGALPTSSGAAADTAPAPVTDQAACDVTSSSADASSPDAAACSADGWTATLTCCGNNTERWTRNGQTKCCGPCFLP